MASSLSSHSSGMSKLSLTQKEMDLPPWDQMLKNGAINPGLVTTSYTDDDSIHEEATEEEKYFSDDDLSENEQLKSGKSKLAAEITPILNLRDYQKELAMNALRGDNTIICAPTGSGKTRVATHIILQHFKLLEERIMKAKVAFLAKTVPLAVQQYKAMCKYMPSYEITVITGQSGEPMSLHMLLRCSDIIVMTPQILENHLNKKLLPHLGVFTMIIFDECHHTRKNDPYNVLMTSYLKVKDKIRNAKEMDEIRKIKLPQIVGLTATIGIGKAVTVEDAVTNIMKICANLDVANLSTVQRHIDELRKVVPVPIEVLQRLRERDEDESVVKIQKLMEKLENQLKHLVKELNDNGFHHEILHDLPGNRKSQAYEQWAVKSKKKQKKWPFMILKERLTYLSGYQSSFWNT